MSKKSRNLILNRKDYERIRHMEHCQMTLWVESVYKSGFKDGKAAASEGALTIYESVDRYIEWLMGDFPFCMHTNDLGMLKVIRKAVEPGSYKEYGLADVSDKYLDQAIMFVILLKYYKIPRTYPLPKNAAEVFNRILEDRFYFSLLEEQIPEYCVLAMARFAANFRYVKEQLPELCLLAVESDPTNLREVREQTFEICLAAVKANGDGVQKILQLIRDSEMRERVKLVINSRIFWYTE